VASLVALVLTCDYGTGVTRAPLAEELGAAANKERIGKRDHHPHDALGRAEAKWLSKMRGTIGH